MAHAKSPARRSRVIRGGTTCCAETGAGPRRRQAPAPRILKKPLILRIATGPLGPAVGTLNERPRAASTKGVTTASIASGMRGLCPKRFGGWPATERYPTRAGPAHFISDWLTLPPCAIRGGRSFGLHPDHNDPRVDRLRDDAGTGGAAAAAHRHDDHVERWVALKQLKRRGADTRDQQRLVAGMDVARATVCGHLLAALAHLVEVTRNADWCAPDERSTGALASPSRFLAMNRLSYACSVANSMVRSATSR